MLAQSTHAFTLSNLSLMCYSPSPTSPLVEVQFSTRIKAKAVQIDMGGEFQALTSLLHTKSIAHRLACSHTSPEWLSKAQAQACG